MMAPIPALRLEGIVKTFPGVRALDGVRVDLKVVFEFGFDKDTVASCDLYL